MTIQLTQEVLRGVFPSAPQRIIDDLIAGQPILDRAGVTHTRTRLAYFLANVEHETGGFAIANLTESVAYSPGRAREIWPSRFRGLSDRQVCAKVGATGPGRDFQLKLMNYVYGGRMGNRPGTDDGSRFIGRGCAQITGREGYEIIEEFTGLDCVEKPELLGLPENQAEVGAGFWTWKKMNPLADAGNWIGVVKRWNGGTIGLADREAKMRGNAPWLAKAKDVPAAIVEEMKKLPGTPPTPVPTKDVVDAATAKERSARKAGGGAVVLGGGGEAANQAKTGTTQPDKPVAPVAPTWLTYGAVTIGVVMVVVASIAYAQKKKAVFANWF